MDGKRHSQGIFTFEGEKSVGEWRNCNYLNIAVYDKSAQTCPGGSLNIPKL